MKLDRLLGILTVLLQADSITAPRLAEKFEVARRTISRDIDALCRAGIPIVTRQGRGGGISVAEGFKLDKSILTAGELSEIVAALRGIGTVSDQSAVERLLCKLSARDNAVVSLREPIVIDLSSHYKSSLKEKIRLIKGAILKAHPIAFDYYSEKGITHRVVEPAVVVFQWAAWYVFGYCTMRQDFRLFKLQRLWELSVRSENFAPREVPAEKRDLFAALPDDKKLVALFDPRMKYRLIETYGLDCYTEIETGQLRLEIGYTHQDYMVSWLLGFGGSAMVVEPREIACALREAAKKMIKAYE